MRPKRQIAVAPFLADMRAGMTDLQLMEKYRVSSRGLQRIFRKLLDVEAITPAQLFGRVPSFEDTVSLNFETLQFPTDENLFCLVPAYYEGDPASRGSICEIGDNGLTVEGLHARPNETKRIVVAAREFFDIDSFAVEARCKWSKTKRPGDLPLAAFEITGISHHDSPSLRNLVRMVKMQDG